jgi:ABC-type antimicrobial peptide transport system permease subunit
MDQFGVVPNLLLHTSMPPMGVVSSVQDALFWIDSEIAVDRVTTIESRREESLASPRLMAALLALFASVALLISSGGIAAVMALTVSQRTNEIGVRMTLGASRRSIVGMILGEGLKLGLAGIAVGALAATVFSRLLSAFLYDTEPMDLATLGIVTLIFVAVAGFACLVPARRATSVDPNVALRCD